MDQERTAEHEISRGSFLGKLEALRRSALKAQDNRGFLKGRGPIILGHATTIHALQ